MNAVLLDGGGDVDEIFVDHGDEGDTVLRGEIAEHFVECRYVVGAVVGGKRDASEKDLDVSGFERGEDRVEVFAGLIGGEAAKAIVATEFDNYD